MDAKQAITKKANNSKGEYIYKAARLSLLPTTTTTYTKRGLTVSLPLVPDQYNICEKH